MSDELVATVTQKKVYNMVINGVELGEFTYKDSWNGLHAFRRAGETVILGSITFGSGPMSMFFDELGSSLPTSGVKVWKVSDKLQEKIKAKE